MPPRVSCLLLLLRNSDRTSNFATKSQSCEKPRSLDTPLIDGKPGQEISGYAFMVHTEEQGQKLARYETNAYEEACCLIYFTDEEEPAEASGKTFMYTGDANAFLEQRFDRKLWLHQMAGKLG